MRYQPIISTLGYVLSPDKTKVLLIHRNARKDDDHLGKYNGLGGKLEQHENVNEGMVREIKEEAGINCTDLSLKGTINWTGFGPKFENWFCFIFRIDSYTGTPYKKNIEGTLEWAPLNKLFDYPMWEGDEHFLPLVFDDNPRPFHGYMPYNQDKMVDWTYSR